VTVAGTSGTLDACGAIAKAAVPDALSAADAAPGGTPGIGCTVTAPNPMLLLWMPNGSILPYYDSGAPPAAARFLDTATTCDASSPGSRRLCACN